MNRQPAPLLVVAALLLIGPEVVEANEPLDRLLAVYATQPQGYPAGKEHARPDTTVPFRWHFYHDRAVERFENARMAAYVDLYNALEDEGVETDKTSAVKWKFVAEHATQGKHALQVDVPAGAVGVAAPAVRIKCVASGTSPFISPYMRWLRQTYGPHYRWIKLDVFNPQQEEIHVRFCGLPMILHPGANVLAVKTADAVERGYACAFTSLPLAIMAPKRDLTLFLDHARMEQEIPEAISRRGRMLQFPHRESEKAAPVLWPGFTPVRVDSLYAAEEGFGWTEKARTRASQGHSFRSCENGILWGCCINPDAPFRIDVPNGRHGIYVMGAPGHGHVWAKGLTIKVNGREHTLLDPHSEAEVRRLALGGETWDFRPGACVWEALVRRPYYPPMHVVYENATDKHLLIEFPKATALHALIVFPEEDKEEALRELGRFNYLLAESWDVSHPWVKGSYAQKTGDGHPYIGLHDEMVHPETIPERLKALKLIEADFARGFALFERALLNPVYPDTIPTPGEAAFKELRCFAAAGQRACVTLGLLPLAERQGLRLTVSELIDNKSQHRILPDAIDVRVSRQHQKCMQFGHHNHDYNYQEHYLLRRPRIDLYPGAVRRAYFDISVSAKAAPGEYRGTITITGADDKPLARVPLAVEVLPITLAEPPVYFASSLADPRLKEYGFNTFATTFDNAVKHGYRAYLANGGYGPLSFKDKKLAWSNFIDNKELVAPLIEAGRDGKLPRGFFGGPAPGTHANPKADAIAREFFEKTVKEFPRIDLLGRTLPVYYHGGYKGLQTPHEWIYLAAPPTPSSAENLEAASKSGKEFWFVDGLRHSKEHAGRFTFGLWLWRLGAVGHYTTLEAHLQYGYGTARPTYTWEPYFTLLDVTTCNVDRAIKDSLTEGVFNPCRDLILLREGIDDYRYLHTLDVALKRGASTKPDSPEIAAAKKFRAELWADVVLDLAKHYEARAGAYGENWYVRPDCPWTGEKLDQVRRRVAEHVIALGR